MCHSRTSPARSLRPASRTISVSAALGVLTFLAAPLEARPGTHPIVVSTWDARASSVLVSYRHGLLDGGGFNTVSYEANFSSTAGTLSSQFGLHYLNLNLGEAESRTLHGLAATATALFHLPVASRFDNGLARAAIGFYVGSAPTALVSGERNYLSIPLVFGVGVPISPAKAVTITPWAEFSPGANLDTVIRSFELTNVDPNDYLTPDGIQLSEDDVERVLQDSVELDVYASIGARAGLDLAFHLSDSFDVTTSAAVSSIGSAFSGARVIYLGGGLVWRWDHIVPAVLPAERRLLHESCADIENRFRSCPNSRNWMRPEDLPTSPSQPAQSAPPRQPAPLRAPVAPAPSEAEVPAPPTTGSESLGPVPAPIENPESGGVLSETPPGPSAP